MARGGGEEGGAPYHTFHRRARARDVVSLYTYNRRRNCSACPRRFTVSRETFVRTALPISRPPTAHRSPSRAGGTAVSFPLLLSRSDFDGSVVLSTPNVQHPCSRPNRQTQSPDHFPRFSAVCIFYLTITSIDSSRAYKRRVKSRADEFQVKCYFILLFLSFLFSSLREIIEPSSRHPLPTHFARVLFRLT